MDYTNLIILVMKKYICIDDKKKNINKYKAIMIL